MEGFVVDWIVDVILKAQDKINAAADALTMSSAQLEGSAMFTAVEFIHGILTPVALIITSICFITEFVKMSIRMDILKAEYVLGLVFKLCLSKAVIDISMDILLLIYQTVSEWIAAFNTLGVYVGDEGVLDIANKLREGLDGLGFWAFLGFALTHLFALGALWIIGILIGVIAWGRIFEIYVNLAIAPIPFAFLPAEGGGNGITKKFALSFAGVCIQGLLILICIKIYQYFLVDIMDIGSISGSPSEIIGQLLLASLVLLISVTKCGQWGKQIMNAM